MAVCLILLSSVAAFAGAAAVTLSPTSLTFATQLKGTTSPAQTVTLTNSGTASLTITVIKAAAPFAQTNNCSSPLAAGASCSISVTFTPQVNGAATGTLSVTDNAKGSPQSVTLAGTGTIGNLTPGSTNFGNQTVGTASAAQVITLTNVGQTAARVSAISIQGANPADFSQTNNCGSVAAGGSCSINVTFTPQATGAFAATVNVTFSSAVSPIPATVTGTGVNSTPVVSLSPTTLTFGSQPVHTVSAAQNVTLTNTGGASLSITSITFGGTNPGDFLQSNTCGSALAAGANCAISVQFQPTSTGTRAASLLITDNATGSPQSVALSGTSPNPVPYLQQPLAPATVAPGSPAPTITVNGAGFTSGSSVLWNGNPRTTTFVSNVQLKAALQASDVANSGTGQVVATNPTPGGGTSNPQPLQIESLSSTVALGGPELAVGIDPRGIIVADFNGDGKPDIAVTNRGSNTISVMLGNGDGTFGAAQGYATGADPTAVAVGDFNGDGKLDLVTSNRAAYTISVLLGNGDGTFQGNVDYPAGTEPIAIVAADFNGDGYWDVAAINAADNTVSIFLGNGNGTLQPQVTYAVVSGPIAIVAGDFNGDGIVDLAVANSGTSNIAVLLGNGDGTFQNAAYYATGSDPDGLFAADLNGDGKLDLVAANNGSNTISVLLNNGNGTFAPNATYPVGALPFGVTGGDFYGNGIIDIAVTNNESNTVSILPGNGDGTFNAAGALTFSTGNEPIELAVGDFNLDGRPDLVASNSGDNTISVLVQVPTVTLSSSSLSFGSQNTGSSSAPQNVVLTNSGSAILSISSISLTNSQYSETNNCPGILAAGNNCTISVTFSPTASGTVAANLTITDNAASSPQTVGLLGTGVSATVQLSPASLTFGSQVVGSVSPAQVVTVTNTGSAALSITSITASANFGETNTCGASLAAGADCSVSVDFAPTTTGTLTGTVSIADNASGSPQTVGLTGTGTGAPAVSLSPTSLTFTIQAVDTSSPAQNVTLTNTGSGPLTITSVATTGDYSQTNTCGTSVAAGANCAISVVFTPITTGTRSGTAVVTDNASNSPQTVTLTGTGGTPTVLFSPTNLSFGNQTVNTSSATKAIKLTNNTGAKLTFSKIATSANYSQTNNCTAGVNAGASCTIGVTFTPTATGVLPGAVTITDSATSSPQSIPLTGTGIAASILFSPSSLTFANQTVGTSSGPSAVTLTNTGTAALTITSVAITGANGADYSQTNTCGSSVAAGTSCSINVIFTPTASGTRTANITVTDSAAGSPQNVPLTGTGIAPTVSFSPASLSFGNQVLGGTSSPMLVTLSNTGNATLTINSILITGANPGDFAQTNNCGSSMAEATSCALSVTFTPTAAGSRQASISVTDNAAGSPQTVTLLGTGTASAVSFSSSSVNFGNQLIGTSSGPSGVTLFNSSFATLTITSIAVAGTDPGDFSQSNNCGGSVASWSYCTINAVFKPTAAGARTATISVTDNAAGSPQSVALNGTGTTGGPTASLSPTSVVFASQNLVSTSSPQTVTLTNSGTATLNINSIVAEGDYAQTNNCGSSLAAGANCAVQVTFSPSATGTRTGHLTFSDSDPSTLQTVILSGTGSQPSSTVSIAPGQASATPGQNVQFTASISGVVSSSVTWSVDGIAGGNSGAGTISSSGLYTAPSAAGPHVVTATSTANTTQTANVPMIVTSYAGTFVYHNDNGRTGQNLSETVLTTGNVNSTQFGKLFSYPVDGQVYGEPLYVQGVSVAGQGVHNVVYVATENDSVYAFDADGLTTTPLWQVSFLVNGAQTLNTTDIGGCANITPQVGITSTPVIDPVSNTIFVLARTKIVSSGGTTFYQTLHALDITTGLETSGSPVVIQAAVNSSNGTVTFNPQTQNQRSGLFIDNGVVYISWASHCDIQPFHGWMMGYQEGTLQQVAVFNSTPNGTEGGIWQSGAAPAVDEYGNIFALMGNGTTDVPTGGVDYGEGLLNLNPATLAVNDYFIPSNYQSLNNSDLDLGAGGVLLLPEQPTPPTDLLIAVGKQGMVYLANRANLGGYNAAGNQVIQTLPAGTVPNAHSMAAYWQNNVYVCGIVDYVKSFLLSGGYLSSSPTSESPTTIVYPGATPVVSANGTANGILWILATAPTTYAELHAYDAANVSRELYNTSQNSTRDQPGLGVKFVVPTVANGKVYIGTQTEVDVYGLLPQP
ncbi:MAG: choice-of-anchor D domain-containing protein [Candidatus Sulfotelmatobacter sp.]